jgi:hypothetical protein
VLHASSAITRSTTRCRAAWSRSGESLKSGCRTKPARVSLKELRPRNRGAKRRPTNPRIEPRLNPFGRRMVRSETLRQGIGDCSSRSLLETRRPELLIETTMIDELAWTKPCIAPRMRLARVALPQGADRPAWSCAGSSMGNAPPDNPLFMGGWSRSFVSLITLKLFAFAREFQGGVINLTSERIN